jgi:hypothetical protein
MAFSNEPAFLSSVTALPPRCSSPTFADLPQDRSDLRLFFVARMVWPRPNTCLRLFDPAVSISLCRPLCRRYPAESTISNICSNDTPR